MKRTAKTVFDRPVHRKPTPAPVPPPFTLALQLLHRGNLVGSRTILDGILRSHPGHADAWHLRGLIAIMGGDNQRGAECIDKAVGLQPDQAVFHFNRGNAYKNLGDMAVAVECYSEAIRLKPDHAAACCNRGIALHALRRFDAALESYDQALRLDPRDADFHFNHGLTLHALRQLDAAIDAFGRAIEFQPDFAEAYCWRGHCLRDSNQMDAAVVSYTKAIEIKPDHVDAYRSRGNVLLIQRDIGAAMADYKRAAALAPDGFLIGDLLHKRTFLCDWVDFEASLAALKSRIERGSLVMSPFCALGLVDSPALQLTVARVWTERHHPAGTTLGVLPENNKKHEKIRIGYYSGDFHNHATSQLMAGLFEMHDRSRFELIAFSYGPDVNDEMRQRVANCFDTFVDVRMMTDQDVAKRSREIAVDIAVDLKGYVADGRLNILAERCAPVQVNFLGYPGTMGADYVEYIVADKILIPEKSQEFYAEKIVYLPDTYQPNDSLRPVPMDGPSRQAMGLPESGFVYCCLNDCYKISPGVFDRWMQILKAVDQSILWLFVGREETEQNLRKEATRRGVDETRLIFCKRVPVTEHLSRYRVADLFLDTLPYNAHTTASEALWLGLPVLTCMGEAFAARVAASLLHAIELPEMITTNLDDYESLAIELARDPERLRQIKDKLWRNRLTTSLFDTARYTRNLEAAYIEMYRRHQQALPPDHIHVR